MIRVGDKLGRFLLNRELGRGSNGVVYEATDTLLNARVALKVLHPWLAGEPQVRERFKRELLLTRRVAHPGICRLFDLHEEKDTVFITMEFVEGCTLSQLLKDQGLLHPPRAIRILRSCAQALSAAHQAGVIHRDLKPGNINVRPDDSVTILDFGIATATDVGRLTRPGQTVGSLRYIPPEVWEGSPATALGDIYALGVISYACLTGRLPYDAPGAVMMLEVLKSSKPTPIPDINPQVDSILSDVVMKAMAIDPAKRYGSAGDFDHALEQCEDPELRAAFEPGADGLALELDAAAAKVVSAPPSGDATKVLQPRDDAPNGDDAAPTKITAPVSLVPTGATTTPPAKKHAPAQTLPRAPPPGQDTVVVDARGQHGGDDGANGFGGATAVAPAPRPMATLDDGQDIADDALSMVADFDVDALGAAFDGALGPTTQPVELPADPFATASVRPAMASKSTGPRGQDVQVVRVSKNSGPNTPATGGLAAAAAGSSPSSSGSDPVMGALLDDGELPDQDGRDAAMAALRVPTDPLMSVEMNAPFLGSPATDPHGLGGAGATVPDHTMIAPMPTAPSDAELPDRSGGADRSDRTVVARGYGIGPHDDDGLDASAEATDPGPLEERRRRQTRNRMLIAAACLGVVLIGGALVAALSGKKPVEPDAKGDLALKPDEPPSKGDAPPAPVPDETKPTDAVVADAKPAVDDDGPKAAVVAQANPPATDDAKPAVVEKPAQPVGDGDSWDLNPDDIAAKAAGDGKVLDKAPAQVEPAQVEPAQVEPAQDEPAATDGDDDAPDVKKERAAPKPGAKDRAAYARAAAAFDKAMKKQGLVPGDLPDADAEAQKARLLAKQGKAESAAQTMERATVMAAGAKITRGMVLKKLDRFNKRYDKVETPAQKQKLTPLSTQISQKLAGGDYEGANALLNKAFGILAKR